MVPWAKLALVASFVIAGCGSGLPPEETVYYDSALRPGVVEATTDAERQLLARLASSDEQAVEHGGLMASAPYAAASGRRCRQVIAADATMRLACESDDGWVFVPQVIGASP